MKTLARTSLQLILCILGIVATSAFIAIVLGCTFVLAVVIGTLIASALDPITDEMYLSVSLGIGVIITSIIIYFGFFFSPNKNKTK